MAVEPPRPATSREIRDLIEWSVCDMYLGHPITRIAIRHFQKRAEDILCSAIAVVPSYTSERPNGYSGKLIVLLGPSTEDGLTILGVDRDGEFIRLFEHR